MRRLVLIALLTACDGPRLGDDDTADDRVGYGCDYTPNVWIEGTVRLADATPAEEATVTWTVDGQGGGSTWTDGDGRFELRTGDSFYDDLTVALTATSLDGTCATSAPVEVVGGPCSEHVVELVLDDCPGG